MFEMNSGGSAGGQGACEATFINIKARIGDPGVLNIVKCITHADRCSG